MLFREEVRENFAQQGHQLRRIMRIVEGDDADEEEEPLNQLKSMEDFDSELRRLRNPRYFRRRVS